MKVHLHTQDVHVGCIAPYVHISSCLQTRLTRIFTVSVGADLLRTSCWRSVQLCEELHRWFAPAALVSALRLIQLQTEGGHESALRGRRPDGVQSLGSCCV